MSKIKVLVLADSPLAPSGVAGQTRYMIEGLLKTGKYQFVCMGGAIRHPDYTPIKVEEYGDDWVIYPVDGYGNQDSLRSFIQNFKPDIVWIMTDPRFWGWLWEIENEIRSVASLVYYHVWDNLPYPTFNRPYYLSNDVIATISKVTDDIVKNVAPEVDRVRIPHTVNTGIFEKIPDSNLQEFVGANDAFRDKDGKKKFIFFWNNRNARRKMSGSVLWWFTEWAKTKKDGNVMMIMHTEPKDPNGQDLNAIIAETDSAQEVVLSVQKVGMPELSVLYNVADCTINISDAEGFGLATLESLSCETPIIVNMTGGMQEQVTDGKEWFGIGIEPSSKAIIGSQDVPFIYEDRVSKKDFQDALEKMYNMPEEERRDLGKKGRQHVLNNYGFESYVKQWDEELTKIYKKKGSWSNRKHESWELFKVL
jgi:glycosyltransferase involved in cell wall biosynthesis